MPDIQLTFVPRPRWGSMLGWFLLFVGLICSAWVGLRAQTLLEQREALSWRLTAASTPPPPPVPISSQAAAETVKLDAVRAGLQASWDPVFDALERSASGKIAFLSIQVTARTGSLELDAQAPTLQDALNAVAILQRQPALRQVLLQRYKRLNDVPGQPVDVRIHAELVP